VDPQSDAVKIANKVEFGNVLEPDFEDRLRYN